jgi:hypothetical protein
MIILLLQLNLIQVNMLTLSFVALVMKFGFTVVEKNAI